MKTFVLKPSAPAALTSLRCSSSEIRMPGARAAKFRKFRLFCGRALICSSVTLVAISLLLLSMRGAAAVTVTAASAVARTVRSSACVWPRSTRTFRVAGDSPWSEAVTV